MTEVFNIFGMQRLTILLHASIFIGVHTVAFFNVSFGWVLSGLVVPGLFAPLLLASPFSAAIVLLEACLAYFLLNASSKALEFKISSQNSLSSAPFGRERFFALVLYSVIARCFTEGILLPLLFPNVPSIFQSQKFFHFLLTQEKHPAVLNPSSMVITALLANQFWKPGFAKGLKQSTVTILITTLVLYFVFEKGLNFPTQQLAVYLSENSEPLFANPGKYLVLLVSAYIASQFNAKFGWDFSGILLPSLLALSFFSPRLLALTFVETFFILIAVQFLLKTKYFSNRNIEGAYRLLFYFNLSLILKIIFVVLCTFFVPKFKFDEYFSVGFLLASLIAMKTQQKKLGLRIVSATVYTAALGIVSSYCVAFVFVNFFSNNEFKQHVFTKLNTAPVAARTSAPETSYSLADLELGRYRASFHEVKAPLNSSEEGSTAFQYVQNRVVQSFRGLQRGTILLQNANQFRSNSNPCLKLEIFTKEKLYVISHEMPQRNLQCSFILPGILVGKIHSQEKLTSEEIFEIQNKIVTEIVSLSSNEFVNEKEIVIFSKVLKKAWAVFEQKKDSILWIEESEKFTPKYSQLNYSESIWELLEKEGVQSFLRLAVNFDKIQHITHFATFDEQKIIHSTTNFESTIIAIWPKQNSASGPNFYAQDEKLEVTSSKKLASEVIFQKPNFCQIFAADCKAHFVSETNLALEMQSENHRNLWTTQENQANKKCNNEVCAL